MSMKSIITIRKCKQHEQRQYVNDKFIIDYWCQQKADYILRENSSFSM